MSYVDAAYIIHDLVNSDSVDFYSTVQYSTVTSNTEETREKKNVEKTKLTKTLATRKVKIDNYIRYQKGRLRKGRDNIRDSRFVIISFCPALREIRDCGGGHV